MSLPRGLERTPIGYIAFVAYHGVRVRKRFPATAAIPAMLEWRERTRAQLVLEQHEQQRQQGPPGSFRADAGRYLEAVKALPTYQERVRDIGLWTDVFGDRPRRSITATEIRAQRDAWLTVGPRMIQRWKADPLVRRKVQTFVAVPGPLAASTVNHRLRALENLWTVLDGRHAPNPVREVPEVTEPDPPPKAIPLAVVRAILAALPDTANGARLRIEAWTGLPHSTLGRIQAEDLDWQGKTVWVPGRRKGAGTRGRRMPLTDQALAAFRRLDRLEAWGPFSRSSTRKAWLRACAVAGIHGLTPYGLRHTVATEMLKATDLRLTQLYLGHSTPALTERYSRAAVPPALEAAARRLDRAQKRAKVGGKSSRKSSSRTRP